MIRRTLIALELFVAVGAGYGAAMLAADAWHLPVAVLRPLPLYSWVLPGLALFAVVCVPMVVAAVSVLRGRRHAAALSLAAGLLLVGWIAVQLLVIGVQMWLQPFMAACGAAIAALAWLWHPPVDELVLRLLGSPMHGLLDRRVCRLAFTGRRSGAAVALPVEFVRDGDRLLVLAARASTKRWWRNFRGGGHDVEVTIAGAPYSGHGLALGPGDSGYTDAMCAYARHRRPPVSSNHQLVLIELRTHAER